MLIFICLLLLISKITLCEKYGEYFKHLNHEDLELYRDDGRKLLVYYTERNEIKCGGDIAEICESNAQDVICTYIYSDEIYDIEEYIPLPYVHMLDFESQPEDLTLINPNTMWVLAFAEFENGCLVDIFDQWIKKITDGSTEPSLSVLKHGELITEKYEWSQLLEEEYEEEPMDYDNKWQTDIDWHIQSVKKDIIDVKNAEIDLFLLILNSENVKDERSGLGAANYFHWLYEMLVSYSTDNNGVLEIKLLDTSKHTIPTVLADTIDNLPNIVLFPAKSTDKIVFNGNINDFSDVLTWMIIQTEYPEVFNQFGDEEDDANIDFEDEEDFSFDEEDEQILSKYDEHDEL